MNDLALALIIQIINEQNINTLLAIDEHSDVSRLCELNDKSKITVLTQRFDQYQQLQALGFTVQLSDYDLTVFKTESFGCIAIRIGKQKDISHYLLKQCHRILPASGKIIVAGAKNEGIKSLRKKLKQIATEQGRTRGKAQHEAYIFSRFENSELLDDHNYAQLRYSPIYESLQFFSKPGIYGWQKIDVGSMLLIDSLKAVGIPAGNNVLDLGCGYGFLAILAATRYDIKVTATDSNIAAINACNANFKQLALSGEAIISDCANTLQHRFDTILCNPPFHSGFNVNGDLTERFIAAANKHLRKCGKAYFVVNDFIPLEKKARSHFNQIKLLQKSNGFKVFELSNT